MVEPFIGEIRLFGFNFPPRNWAFCDGEVLSIEQNQALFSILGSRFGGDGRTSFGIPDLRGRAAVHVGTGYSLGQRDGEESHQLTVDEMPSHTHNAVASSGNATTNNPTGGFLARAAQSQYRAGPPNVAMNAETLANAGGTPHENMQPFLTVNFSIALTGTFPPRN